MTTTIPFLDLQAQYHSCKEEIDAAIARVIAHGRFILGPEVSELEAAVAARSGQATGVGVASGTDALVIALRAAGVKPGDEVITTPLTFIASAEPALAIGAKVVFADIDPATYNLDPQAVAAKITKRTKAIIAVHLYGLPCAMDRLTALAREHGLVLIEDCAQAFGATYAGQPVGSFGQIACHSFFPSKILGGYGDGGMLCMSDPVIAEQARILRHHGCKTKYYPVTTGYNSRLDTLQAAILLAKLPNISGWLEGRHRVAGLYQRALADTALTLPAVPPDRTHAFYAYTIRAEQRDALTDKLRGHGIPVMVYYPVPLHLTDIFRSEGYQEGDFPLAEQACREVMSLPIYPELTEAQVSRIAGCC